jgi:uncharacterized protein
MMGHSVVFPFSPHREFIKSVQRGPSFILRLLRRFEIALHFGDWAVRLTRALGIRPTVKTTYLRVEGNGRGLGGTHLSIAYASDFHAGPTTDPEVLRSACAALRAEDPDILLLGGDFVNFTPREIDLLLPELASIPARLGRFAVLGNHDWLADPSYITDRLQHAGIEVLTNRNVRLPPPFEHVWICGLDDHWCGRPDGRGAFAGADGFRIVLMHAPSGLLDIGDHRFDLAFCGHTHGGQIALPGGRPLVLPNGALSRRYARGRFQLTSERTLVVSVGVGCALLPLRVHADPEVIACTLTWLESSASPAAEAFSREERPVETAGGADAATISAPLDRYSPDPS